MNPPFVQIVKEDLEVSEPKEPEAVWRPIRAIKEEWDKDLDMEKELAAYRERVTNFIKHQKELSAKDTDDAKDYAVEKETLNRNVEVGLGLDKEYQRKKLIEKDIKEDIQERREGWEKDLSNKLVLFNDLKREYIFGYNLTNPIPIEYCSTSNCEESATTASDLKNLIARKMPRVSLDKMLTEPTKTWTVEILPKKPDLSEELYRIFRDNIGPTMTVVIDNKKYFCHSIMLGLMSNFFNKHKKCNIIHLPGSKVTKRSFVNIYRWMFEPINSLMVSQLIELLHASQSLDIEELAKQCWRLTHDILRNADHILAMYTASQEVCGSIERVIIPYVGRVWLPYASSTEFLNLEFNKIRRFLQMDNLAVNSEMEVLYSAIHWLDGDWPRRKLYAIDLMRAVRFELLPFVFLIVFAKRKDGPPALKYIRESAAVRKLISEALQLRNTSCGKIQRNSGISLRDWIYDPSCSYHHGHKCNAARFVTYSDFAGYINWLQKFGFPIGNRIKRYTDDDIVCC